MSLVILVLSEDIISWDMYLIIFNVIVKPSVTDAENVKTICVSDSSNLVNFRVKASGSKISNVCFEIQKVKNNSPYIL